MSTEGFQKRIDDPAKAEAMARASNEDRTLAAQKRSKASEFLSRITGRSFFRREEAEELDRWAEARENDVGREYDRKESGTMTEKEERELREMAQNWQDRVNNR